MIVKIGKKEKSKAIKAKIKRVSKGSKQIVWNKYVGKINIPVDALSYQEKMRDEWS